MFYHIFEALKIYETAVIAEITVEIALTEITNLMTKIYGNTAIVLKPTKNMKATASLFGFMVPMKLGV